MYICQSQSCSSSHPPLRPLVSILLFSTSVSLFLPCKQVHLYHFSRFHIYALPYDICFSLSLRFIFWANIWSYLENVSVHLRRIYILLLLSEVFYGCLFSWFIMLLKCLISLLIICQLGLLPNCSIHY